MHCCTSSGIIFVGLNTTCGRYYAQWAPSLIAFDACQATGGIQNFYGTTSGIIGHQVFHMFLAAAGLCSLGSYAPEHIKPFERRTRSGNSTFKTTFTLHETFCFHTGRVCDTGNFTRKVIGVSSSSARGIRDTAQLR